MGTKVHLALFCNCGVALADLELRSVAASSVLEWSYQSFVMNSESGITSSTRIVGLRQSLVRR